MTDQNQQETQEFGIHSIYIKDVSFESPNSPAIFMEQIQPNIQMDLNIESKPLGNDVFEIILSITVTAKADDKTAFLVELQQAGAFGLRGFSEDTIGPMLGIYCPNLLFPYAREAISNLVTKGGFPQLLLEPVNFEALYAEHMQQHEGSVQ
jgi:preprotein translocase subunit SecB